MLSAMLTGEGLVRKLVLMAGFALLAAPTAAQAVNVER
jgi:hypothetical protein